MDQNALKAEVGRVAAARVEDGMVLGLGSGSTSEAFLKSLGGRVADGLTVRGVPTSERTASLCRELGIELTDLERDPALDLAIDGADEIDPDFNLIKGGGGALLREKIVAAAADRMLVIADASKQVEHLGAFRLPVEITPFGAASTIRAVESICSQHGLNGDLRVRPNLATQDADRAPFVTDGGHWIIDCPPGAIDDPKALDEALRAVPGVMETGLFIALADQALIAGKDAVEALELER